MEESQNVLEIYDKMQDLIENADNIVITQLSNLLLGACEDLVKIADLQNLTLRSLMNDNLFEWYESQKLVDMLERKRIRKEAISKLTLEERKVLGLV